MFDTLKTPRGAVAALLLLFLAALPIYVTVAQQPFLLTLFSRIMIYAVAALSLNILIGYVGLVSLGHAMFLMLGAYAVGLMQFHGYGNGWLQLLVAIGVSIIVAFITGWISLRTSGMAFIMITLAFAQMFFFLGISLKEYGGDDGMRLEARSLLAPFDLTSNMTLYYLIFCFMVLVLIASYFLINSRFGFVLRAIKSNERRIKALGFSADRYKMGAMIIAAVICAVAGFLLANLTKYTSPSYGAWNISGELIVIVVLGGMGTLFGPLVGAIALLLFEEFLTSSSIPWVSTHWQLILGATIVLIVLLAKRGLYGSIPEKPTASDAVASSTAKGSH
jgi:branched-chain amino acid transport system permease protein